MLFTFLNNPLKNQKNIVDLFIKFRQPLLIKLSVLNPSKKNWEKKGLVSNFESYLTAYYTNSYQNQSQWTELELTGCS